MQEIEEAAVTFAQDFQLTDAIPLDQAVLAGLIHDQFGYELDTSRLETHETLSNYRSVFIEGRRPKVADQRRPLSQSDEVSAGP